MWHFYLFFIFFFFSFSSGSTWFVYSKRNKDFYNSLFWAKAVAGSWKNVLKPKVIDLIFVFDSYVLQLFVTFCLLRPVIFFSFPDSRSGRVRSGNKSKLCCPLSSNFVSQPFSSKPMALFRVNHCAQGALIMILYTSIVLPRGLWLALMKDFNKYLFWIKGAQE